MMNHLELSEDEMLELALAQLKAQGKIPIYPIMVQRFRSTEVDEKGQHTFTYRWEELTASEAKEWEEIWARRETPP